MLQVCVVIGGALIAFVSMVLWANSGRFKSENDSDISNALTAITFLISADIRFAVDVLVLVASDRRVAVLRSMLVGAVMGGPEAVTGRSIMAAIRKPILVAPVSRVIR